MLDGTYSTSLNTPMGNMNGMITLITNGNSVQGIIEVMGSKSSFSGVKVSNDKCTFNGNLKTPIGAIDYKAICTVIGDILNMEIYLPQGSFKMTGKRKK